VKNLIGLRQVWEFSSSSRQQLRVLRGAEIEKKHITVVASECSERKLGFPGGTDGVVGWDLYASQSSGAPVGESPVHTSSFLQPCLSQSSRVSLNSIFQLYVSPTIEPQFICFLTIFT